MFDVKLKIDYYLWLETIYDIIWTPLRLTGSFVSNAIFLHRQIKFGLTWPLDASFVQKEKNYSLSELKNSIPVNTIVNKWCYISCCPRDHSSRLTGTRIMCNDGIRVGTHAYFFPFRICSDWVVQLFLQIFLAQRVRLETR